MSSQQEPQPALRLRRLTQADLAFADSVRALAGWNQTLADWERFLRMAPEGCFLAEWHGTPAGTATTTIYGRALAWIGMVLVHPDFRRRGIGRALLQHCVTRLRDQAVRCIKLDATPAGKLVYDGLGFQSEWPLSRWAGRPTSGAPVMDTPGIRSFRPSDMAAIEMLDTRAFGVSRQALLLELTRQSRDPVVIESEPGGIKGFGLARAGSQALYLGPVVAESDSAGLDLVQALIARNPAPAVFWDIPDANEAAVSWAQSHGLVIQRPLTRMFLGENSAPGVIRRVFALAGPEIG